MLRRFIGRSGRLDSVRYHCGKVCNCLYDHVLIHKRDTHIFLVDFVFVAVVHHPLLKLLPLLLEFLLVDVQLVVINVLQCL